MIVRWTPAAIDLLGTVPDRVVANRLHCSITAVAVYRGILGIEPGGFRGRTARVWTADEDALLGTVNDRVAAERIGVSFTTVRLRRLRLGIPPLNHRGRPRWDDTLLRAELAALTNREFAERHGVTKQWAHALRQRTGVPRPPRRRPLPPDGKFRSATVLGLTDDSGAYRLRCRCGAEFTLDFLRTNRSTCGNCPKGGSYLDCSEIAGREFHRLTARRPVEVANNRRWYFDCACGTKDFVAFLANVRRGLTKSCGCLLATYHSQMAGIGFGWHDDSQIDRREKP